MNSLSHNVLPVSCYLWGATELLLKATVIAKASLEWLDKQLVPRHRNQNNFDLTVHRHTAVAA